MPQWHFPPSELIESNVKTRPDIGRAMRFLYCWWTCPVIASFWNDFLTQIKLITGFEKPLA